MESLYVMHGRDEGCRFVLQDDFVSVGRDSSNTIQIHDSEVSRRHAEIRMVDYVRTLIDQNSSNGVYVNGVRIRQQPIVNGDQIQMGGTLFLYTSSDNGSSFAQKSGFGNLSSELPASNQPSRIIQSLSPDEGNPIFVMSNERAKESSWLAKAKAHLNFIYHTTLVISHTLDIDHLLHRVMDMVFKWVSIDSGCILLWNDEEQRLVLKVSRDGNGETRDVAISQTILDYVLKKNEGVLTSNAQNDQRWDPAASIVQRGVREAICVPMQGRYGLVGVIYIDTSRTAFNLARENEKLKREQSSSSSSEPKGNFGYDFDPASENGGLNQTVRYSTSDNSPIGTKEDSSLSSFWLPGRKLTRDDLKLMSAIAHQTALAVEDTQYYLGMVQAERLAAVGQTVAILSHHIKNILQGIRGGSYLIDLGLKEHDEELVRKGWGIVEKNQSKISDLVLDMLTFSKERTPVLDRADINKVLDDVVELMQGRCTDLDVHLDWMPGEDIPTFFFDAEQLNRAVMNLVTNAIDAAKDRLESDEDEALVNGEVIPSSSKTTGLVEVRSRFNPKTQTVLISVDDNGSGVDPDVRDVLFRPFLSKNKSSGTGLGLAVTNKIVQEHHGKVDVDDSPLGGARFIIELPVLWEKTHEPGPKE